MNNRNFHSSCLTRGAIRKASVNALKPNNPDQTAPLQNFGDLSRIVKPSAIQLTNQIHMTSYILIICPPD